MIEHMTLCDGCSLMMFDEFGLSTGRKVRKQDLQVGLEITDGYCDWIITDVLGDGQFKAVPEDLVTDKYGPQAPILRRRRKPSPSQSEEDKTTPSAKHGRNGALRHGGLRQYL
jgi:hypothetical protein